MYGIQIRHSKHYLRVTVAMVVLAIVSAACAPAAVGPTATPEPATETPAEPTIEPTLEVTETPEPSPTETDTPPPTETATSSQPTLRIRTPANCRRGPGVVYGIVTAVGGGTTHDIRGQSRFFGPLWWLIRVEGTDCWVYSDLVETSGDMGSVAVVTPPDTPTPAPTAVRSPTPAPLVNPFALTIRNNSGKNLCFLFIIPHRQTGWGSNQLPRNSHIPDDGAIAFNLSAGRYNLRAEDCKDDIIEISLSFNLTRSSVWVVGPEPTDVPQQATNTPTQEPTATATQGE